jgi:hypothetical protein
MPDREKVIKGLECCSSAEECGKQCPYWDDEGACRTHLEADALALLKAQEPVEPQEKREGDYKNLYCGACGRGIVGYVGNLTGKHYKESDYCYECGREVKWNDKGRARMEPY